MTTELELGERLTDAATAAPDQLGIPVEELRRRGARRRRTRVAATSAATVLAVAVAGGGAVALSGGFGGAGAATVGAPPSVAAAPSGSAVPSGDPNPDLLAVDPATTIDTGEAVAGGTLTLWFAPHDGRFLQVVGVRAAGGRLAVHGVTNDPEITGGAPGAAGFHAGWQFGEGQDRFVTGYLVTDPLAGDVAKVSLTVDGQPMTARTATWSGNPAVRVWWLRVPDPAGTQQYAQIRDLTGFDAGGKVLAVIPDGGVGVG
jgi:hypothetical protein